jgi:hypothetical protein
MMSTLYALTTKLACVSGGNGTCSQGLVIEFSLKTNPRGSAETERAGRASITDLLVGTPREGVPGAI